MRVFCLMLAISTKHESILNASSVCTPVFMLSNSHLIFIIVINCKIHFDFSCCKKCKLGHAIPFRNECMAKTNW